MSIRPGRRRVGMAASATVVRDRLIGIFFGLAVFGVVEHLLWPVRAAEVLRACLAEMLRLLAASCECQRCLRHGRWPDLPTGHLADLAEREAQLTCRPERVAPRISVLRPEWRSHGRRGGPETAPQDAQRGDDGNGEEHTDRPADLAAGDDAEDHHGGMHLDSMPHDEIGRAHV